MKLLKCCFRQAVARRILYKRKDAGPLDKGSEPAFFMASAVDMPTMWNA